MPHDNTNKGTIAKNDRKESDNHPDIAGSLNVDGKEFWINGWLKTNSRDGSKFYSLSVKPKQERAQEIRREVVSGQVAKPATGRQPSYAEQSGGDLSDEIPF